MQSQLRIALRPNNQITITKGSWKKALPETASLLGTPSPDRYQLARFRDALKRKPVKDLAELTFEEKLDKLFPPLDIIENSQHGKKAPCMTLNRPKSFTRFSGQKVRESGAAISIASNNQPRFAHEVTLTLPANTKEAKTAIAAYSGYAINRLFQPIRRRYGNECLWFFVWEYQKRGALHLHLCVYHPDEAEGQYICSTLIEQWHKILCDISALANTCMFTAKQGDRCTIRSKHQHHTAPIRKDVGCYFSKYAGKSESKNNWYVQQFPVSRFWGSSYSVKKIIKENSIQIDYDYQGNGKETDRRYSELIEEITENSSVVSVSQYTFLISTPSKSEVRKYPNGRKIIRFTNRRIIAEGERTTIYTDSIGYQKILERLNQKKTEF